MTDYLETAAGGTVDADRLRAALLYAAHAPPDSQGTPGWIAPDDMALTDVAGGSALDAFRPDVASSDLQVRIRSGEAVVAGTYLARDTGTDVQLPANSTTTVVVGFQPGDASSLYVGPASGHAGPALPVATYDTDGASVTNQTDDRTLGPLVDVANQRYEGEGGSVASADDAGNLGGRSPAFYYRDTGVVSFPLTTVDVESSVSDMEYVPTGKEMAVTRVVFTDEFGQTPSGTDLVITDADGELTFDTIAARHSQGTLSAPVTTVPPSTAVRFTLRNQSGSAHRLSAKVYFSLVNA